jgi:uncharacterized membrane protein YfcA
MIDNATSALAPWSSFYVLIGSAAASLTGLMFVVITLVMGTSRRQNAEDGISTFSTPTVVHFGAALMVAAILSAPWHLLVHPAIIMDLVGLCGIMYVLRIMRRAKRFTSYDPDVEDWTWHWILPFIAYAVILAGAISLPFVPASALFVVAFGEAILVVVGIHNAWDIVTYIALGNADDPPKPKETE